MQKNRPRTNRFYDILPSAALTTHSHFSDSIIASNCAAVSNCLSRFRSLDNAFSIFRRHSFRSPAIAFRILRFRFPTQADATTCHQNSPVHDPHKSHTRLYSLSNHPVGTDHGEQNMYSGVPIHCGAASHTSPLTVLSRVELMELWQFPVSDSKS